MKRRSGSRNIRSRRRGSGKSGSVIKGCMAFAGEMLFKMKTGHMLVDTNDQEKTVQSDRP